MSALIDVILPVFLIIGFGYLAARAKWINGAEIDGIMRFAQGFALPVLLFKNIATIDLATDAGVKLVKGQWRYSDTTIVEGSSDKRRHTTS